MPAATEKIPDKIPFNVYAMMIILTFVFTGTATWMMGDELNKVWHYFDNKEEKDKIKKATHITVMNQNTEKFPDNFQLTEEDKTEWELCVKSLYPKDQPDFPEKDYEWPAGFDPLTYSVQYNGDNLNPSQGRPDQDKQAQILLNAAGKGAATTEPPKTEAPKAPETPAAPATPATPAAPATPATPPPAPEKK